MNTKAYDFQKKDFNFSHNFVAKKMRNYSKIALLCLLFFIAVDSVSAQKRYWVFFSDKEGVEFDPRSYFDKSLIDKRLRDGLPLYRYSDLPVRRDFISKIEHITGKKGTESRWFNAIAIEANERQLQKIKKEIFITGIREIVSGTSPAEKKFGEDLTYSQSYLLNLQTRALGSGYFHKNNIDGHGVRIAVFDGGFPGVDKSPVFEHLRNNNRIIATYDFIKKDTFVYDYQSHGTSTLTCIAGMLGDIRFGLATGAEFLLARTEAHPKETISEEENWIAAIEWAYRNGADIVSSSLGYTYHRYFPKQMDGKTTMISRAANMAASKGLLIVNAAGNDGDEKWEVIGAPADADSVLSVGGISPDRGWHIDFSSYGPTYDGRMKPNVCAFGEVVTTDDKKIKTSYGTSFSAPLISGFAACVLQMNPAWDNMKLFDEIQKSGHLYPYYDYAHGYGVPQASYFTGEKKKNEPAFLFTNEEGILKVVTMKVSETRSDNSLCCDEIYDLDKDYLYFHIIYEPGDKINSYGIVKMKNAGSFNIPLEMDKKGAVSVYFRGYVETYSF